MKLKPLQQWICDTCGQVIEKPEDGWVEWNADEHYRYHTFRICHHITASPLQNQSDEGCYTNSGRLRSMDDHLEAFLGPNGIVGLLAGAQVGPILDPGGTQSTRIGDHVSWAETFRRLHVPYYEEARQYFSQAKADGFYEGENEVSPFLAHRLRAVIEKFG